MEGQDYKSLKNNSDEKSEAEHNELIGKANTGISAIKKLGQKYGKQTEVEFPDGIKIDLEDLDIPAPVVRIKP